MISGLAPYAPYIALGVVALVFALFLWERYPPEIVALSGAALLLALGVIDSEAVLAAVANPAPATIAAMFMLSAALVRTGVLDALGGPLDALAARRPAAAVGGLLTTSAGASAFMNNTPVVMVMIPIVIRLARRIGVAPSRLLIPLSYMVILGGTCTLIGTSTNLLVDGVARNAGLDRFGLFEIAPLGVIVAIVGGIYLLLAGPRLLPDRGSVGAIGIERQSRNYLVEVFIPAESPLVGRKATEVELFRAGGMRLVDVIRGDMSLRRALANVTLAAGDRVVLRGPDDEIMTIREDQGTEFPRAFVQAAGSRNSIVGEILIGPSARVLGRTLGQLRWRRRYGVYPIALHREGVNLEARLEEVPLAVGDTLLVDGAAEDLMRLADDMRLTNLTASPARAVRRAKAPIAVGALLAVVGLSALGVGSILSLALIAVAVVLLTGCVDPDEGFGAMDARLLVLIVAMLAIGSALDSTGALALVIDGVAPLLRDLPPLLVLLILYAITSALTELVTNNAVGVVVTPLAIGLAHQLGLDPRPFVVAVMFGASASFATPIGYQTNTLVYAAGGYLFRDFLLIGVPMNIVVGFATCLAIPLFWPL